MRATILWGLVDNHVRWVREEGEQETEEIKYNGIPGEDPLS